MAKCKFCKKPNAQFKAGLSSFCDFECATGTALKLNTKAKNEREKAELRDRKNRLAILNQTVSHWRPKAQIAFNRFIRFRDHNLNCISCDRTEAQVCINYSGVGGVWDCGHYLSVGSAGELRFSEDNAHKQCKNCNRDKSGNVVKYRVLLIKRIGLHRVELLEEPAKQIQPYIDKAEASEDKEQAFALK